MPDVLDSPAPSSTLTEVVLDPSEVAADREELNLNAGPIRVGHDGPEWGDAAIEQYLAQAERGQIPVDFRIPNRQIKIPLLLGTAEPANFASARADLQAKVGLFQREGGWLRRGDGLYADIVNATLTLPDRWGYKGFEPDVILVLEAIPDFYGDEIELADATETSDPELIAIFAGIQGNHPGRVRIVVDEDDGESQLGLIWGLRSRHYDAAATAQLAYEAEALTPFDTAAATALTGASGSGSNTVRHNNLATSWTPVLSTQAVSGGDHMTHKGSYRVWARVYSTSGDDVQLRFVWDVGDLALPVENSPQRLPQTGSQFYLVDLGEIRLDPTGVGDHRWQGVIQGKGDAGGENVSIDRVYVVPVDEGYGVLRAPVTGEQGLATFSARDEFNQTAGALAGKILPVGGTWAGAGDADDFAVQATSHVAERVAVSDVNFIPRFELAGATSYAAVTARVDFKASANPADFAPFGGVLVRYVDIDNWLWAFVWRDTVKWVCAVAQCEAGTVSTPVETVIQAVFPLDTFYTFQVSVDASGRVTFWVFPAMSSPGTPVMTRQHAALATGGVLASGKVGIADWYRGTVVHTRTYDNFAAWVPTTDAVLHPNQSAELRSDGHIREDSAGAAYGPVSQVIGDLPRLPPAGLEDRTVELFVKASRGDLDQVPDSGIDDLSTQVHYRPSWLFVPGS